MRDHFILKTNPTINQSLRILFSIVLFLSSIECFSQNVFHHRRDNIYDAKYDGKRNKLATAMHAYITPSIIDSHAKMDRAQQGLAYMGTGIQTLDTQHIHTTRNFLPWHRQYIRGMEAYLLTLGTDYEIFVPLPYWDPADQIPNDFSVVDADCSLAIGEGNCNPMDTSWTSQPADPQYITGNDLCTFGSGSIDHDDVAGFSDHLEDDYHTLVHFSLDGLMRDMKSPSVPLFWLWHAYVDEIWYSYDCNCQQNYSFTNDLTIHSNTTWSNSKYFLKGQVTIQNGATLTINENVIVEFAPSNENFLGYADNNKAPGIVVKPGSKLEVKKGAKIQSMRFFGQKGYDEGSDANGNRTYKGIDNYYFTHDVWNGITVEGPTPYNGQVQFTNTGAINKDDFGVVILHGGAEINDAKIGIKSVGGGIIQTVKNIWDAPATSDANRVKFNDCLVSIQIDEFKNQNLEYRNACYISDCNFKWNYRNPLLKDYENRYFIKLDRVYGLDIAGCTFENAENQNTYIYGGDPASYSYVADKRGTGIKATDATFLLRKSGQGGGKTPEGCPILPGRVNLFKGLSFGVFAEFTNVAIPSTQLAITESNFQNNHLAINAAASKNLLVANNTFSYTHGSPYHLFKFGVPYRFIKIVNVDEKVSIVNNSMTSNYPTYFIDVRNTGSNNNSGHIREIHYNDLTYTGSITSSSDVRGINLYGANDHLNLTCNAFFGLRNDWYINPGANLKSPQGAPSNNDVNNSQRGWSSNVNPVVKNIVNNGNAIHIHATLTTTSYTGTVTWLQTNFASCAERACTDIVETSIFDSRIPEYTISCYPNPATNAAYFNYNFKIGIGKASFIIVDINGRQKLVQPLNRTTGTLEINTTDYPAGMYFYRLLIDDITTESGKLLIVK